MSYWKSLIRVLDRPGGRRLLGSAATRIMLNGDPNYEIKYIDGIWTRRGGSHYLLDGPKFQYAYEDPRHWIDQLDQYLIDAKEFWLRYYQPKKGDVIVDVGAGRGEDTFAFSRSVGGTGFVIAIEAHPTSFAILRNFCRLNRLTNVMALQVALMDRAGTVRIAESDSVWSENSIEYGEGSSPEVRATTLDKLCQDEKVKNIDFLKMNIEGAERYALPGMMSIMPHIRQICVACHDFRAEMGHGEQFRTRAFVERFLMDFGFTLASRADDPRNFVRDHIFGLRRSENDLNVNR